MIEKLKSFGEMAVFTKVNEIIDQLNLKEENRKKILEELDKMVVGDTTDGGYKMEKDYVSTSMMIDRNGGEEEIFIDGHVDYSVDSTYGSDSNGGFGECKVFVEDVYDVAAYDIDGEDVDLSVKEGNEAKIVIGNKFLEDYI